MSESFDNQCVTSDNVKAAASKKAKVRTFSDTQWYVALVQTNCERKTSDIMEGFDSSHRVNVWLPLQVIRKGDDAAKTSFRLDIHNYIFFHLPKTDEDNARVKYETLRDIRSISYVQGLLIDPATREPARIPNFQIKRFQRMLSDSRHPTTLIPSMTCKGMKVRVNGGPLTGLEGRVADTSRGESMIYISLDCLGCAVTAVNTRFLEVVDDGKASSNVTDGRAKVTAEEWLGLHPYKEQLSVDRLYVSFASALVEALADPLVFVPASKRKRMALSLAAYVEDKRTRLGMFDYFVKLRHNGVAHPLLLVFPEAAGTEELAELLSAYNARAVNLIDLMYFLKANDNGKPRAIGYIVNRAERLLKIMEKLGYDKLPSNNFYVTHILNLTQGEGLEGLKRLMSWAARRVCYYSYDLLPLPDAGRVFCPYPEVSADIPVSFALQLAKRIKAKTVVTRTLTSMLNTRSEVYEVVGCYRKAIHLMSPAGKKHIVYLDSISAADYSIGQHYACRLVEVEKDKWYMVAKAERVD